MSYSNITIWRREHSICPTCGVEFSKLHPESNLVPHWQGECKQPPIPSPDAYAELREKLAKASRAQEHVHHSTGDLLRCVPCMEAREAEIGLREDAPKILPGLLDELAKLRSEREVLHAFVKDLSGATMYKSHPLGYEDSLDHHWKEDAAELLERLAGERT